MEERKESGLPFTILSARNYARFHSTEFLVAVPITMVDPVHDLADIITTIARRNHYTGNTIVTFSFKDDNGRSVFLNRIEGKLVNCYFYKNCLIAIQIILRNCFKSLRILMKILNSVMNHESLFCIHAVLTKRVLLYLKDYRILRNGSFQNLIDNLRIPNNCHYHL